jgi:hypothetical protein
VNTSEFNAAPSLSLARLAGEFVLRMTGAALQVLATWAVVHALEPQDAGVYFEGFVLAYGLSGVLRNKYEMYIAHYIVSGNAASFGIPVRKLLYALSRRTLIRCAIACAAFLVLTTDLDIQEPHLAPYLQTFLPFVLGLPFWTMAMLFAGILRAANRSLGSIMISAYAVNLALIVAALLAPQDYALLVLSWAFLGGSILAAGIGLLIVRRAFPVSNDSTPIRSEAWLDVYAGVAANGYTGLALAGLQWGPLCVLAVTGPAPQIAAFAAIRRTAQIIEFMLPAMYFVPCGPIFQPRFMQSARSAGLRLAANTAVALGFASIWLAILLIFGPWLLNQYGAPYDGLGMLLIILLCTQWVNGVGRPAISYLAGTWHPRFIRNALSISAIVAISIAILGARDYGAYAAGFAAIVGALLVNGQAGIAAWRLVRTAPSPGGGDHHAP